jgi:AbrB family looped-hinge helix DNA binding protein
MQRACALFAGLAIRRIVDVLSNAKCNRAARHDRIAALRNNQFAWRRSPMRHTLIRSIKDKTVQAVTVSPKFQVVIPQSVREAMGLRPGVKLQVVHFENRIEQIPLRSGKSLRGSFIYAKAQAAGALVWTQDADFDGLEGVRYFAKALATIQPKLDLDLNALRA